MNTLNFTGALMTLLFIIVGVYAVITENAEKDEATKKCEYIGGVYVDNMRKVGKSTTHEYMCLRKTNFLMTDKTK